MLLGDASILSAKKPPRSYNRQVHDDAIDDCEKAYVAADGTKQKAHAIIFDDKGVMAIVCRHDIPLFFANIDTPGEQQKYAIALIEHVFAFLPANATVALLYDVGCTLDRSLNLVCAMPPSLSIIRLSFFIS